jgi:hypothetical protein
VTDAHEDEPLEVAGPSSFENVERNGKKGWKPVTVTDSWVGKPLKINEPHGRYQGDSLEGLSEVYVVEAVRIGMDGPEVGSGMSAFVNSLFLRRRRGRKTMRGAWTRMLLFSGSLLLLDS